MRNRFKWWLLFACLLLLCAWFFVPHSTWPATPLRRAYDQIYVGMDGDQAIDILKARELWLLPRSGRSPTPWRCVSISGPEGDLELHCDDQGRIASKSFTYPMGVWVRRRVAEIKRRVGF